MLLVHISFFLCWVEYALEGSTFSLSKCDFFTQVTQRGHGTNNDLLWFLFLVGRICRLKRIFFDLF